MQEVTVKLEAKWRHFVGRFHDGMVEPMSKSDLKLYAQMLKAQMAMVVVMALDKAQEMAQGMVMGVNPS